MFKQIFLPLIAVAGFITVVGLLSQGKLNSLLKISSPVPKTELKIIKINNIEINVEVAKTAEEKSKGLSNREKLEEKNGMLFIFTKDSKPVFWMKDTKFALDIIWINDEKIIGIEKDVQPEVGKKDSELKKYSPPTAIDYVLEVNAGFSDVNKIKIGDTVELLQNL